MSPRHRAETGRLLPQDDPRVQAALNAMTWVPEFPDGSTVDWRDAAEVVNAVLEADDRMAAKSEVKPQQVHAYKDNISWGGSGRDGDPWMMLSWDIKTCHCQQPWSHRWSA